MGKMEEENISWEDIQGAVLVLKEELETVMDKANKIADLMRDPWLPGEQVFGALDEIGDQLECLLSNEMTDATTELEEITEAIKAGKTWRVGYGFDEDTWRKDQITLALNRGVKRN